MQHPNLEADDLDTFEGRWSANAMLARIVERMRTVGWDSSIEIAWKVGLNRDEGTPTRDVFEGIGQVSRLLRQAKTEVQSLESAVRRRADMQWPKVEELLNHSNLSEPWKRFANRIDEGLLERLIANHHALLSVLPLAYSAEYLAQLRSELFALLERVEAAKELPEELRIVLVQMLEGMINAINAYRWTGPEGLRKEMVEFNFNHAVHHEVIDANKRNPLVQETLQKVGLFQSIALWIRRDVAVAGFVAQAFIAPVVQAVTTEAIQYALPKAKVEQLLLLPGSQPAHETPAPSHSSPSEQTPASVEIQTPV